MHTIWKFKIPERDTFMLAVPAGARFLSLQLQQEKPVMWFLVDPELPSETRKFVISGTGHPIPETEKLTHLGTFQLFGGEFVAHAFEYRDPMGD